MGVENEFEGTIPAGHTPKKQEAGDEIPQSLQAALKRYAEKRLFKEDMDERSKELGKELESIEVAIIGLFEAQGVSSVKIPDLGTFTRTEKLYASLKAETKPEGMQKLKEREPSIVVETVNAQTLSAYVREARRTGQDITWLDPFLNAYQKKDLSWRK